MSNSKILIGLALAGLLVWYVLKPEKEFQATQKQQPPQMEIEPVSEAPAASLPAASNIGTMQKQREIFNAEADLQIMHFKPQMQDDKFAFSIRYSPIERRCVDGDIDLIRRHVAPNSELSWIWENHQGEVVAPPLKVSVRSLTEPFTQKVAFSIPEQPMYYRLALCLHPNGDTCSRIEPIDYQQIQKEKQPPTMRAGLFFAQYFRVDSSGIRIFDSTVFNNMEGLKKYAKGADGSLDNLPFLETMMRHQKSMGSLPLKLNGKSLDVHLYVRNNEGC